MACKFESFSNSGRISLWPCLRQLLSRSDDFRQYCNRHSNRRVRRSTEAEEYARERRYAA